MFEKFGPPPENSSPPLVSQASYRPDCISLNNLGPSQETLRPTWCSKLVTGLGKTVWWIGFFDE